MESTKKLGNYDYVKRNYEYIILAQQNGFFQDGYKQDDIMTCSDCIVVHWIDELESKKEDKEKFVLEILPTFKRWFSNGLESTGAGREYDLLKLAERYGIKIDNASFYCLTSLTMKKLLKMNNKYSSYQEMSSYFQIKEILENLVRFNKSGIPISYSLANCYDSLLALEESGELVDFDTLVFFHTAASETFSQDMNLYEDKKTYEERYGYSTCNADEIKKLNNWLRYLGGYNIEYVGDLNKKVKKLQEKINRYGLSKEKIECLKDKKVSISYITLDEDDNKELHKISGVVVDCRDDSITLKVSSVKNDEFEEIVISNNDTSIITKIVRNSVYFYECKTLKEIISAHKLKLKIKEVESQDIASQYIEKFGTIEGLAYLKTGGSKFISLVNKEQFPIDNLFTYCFETISSTFSRTLESQELLQYTLAAYNKVLSGEIESLKDCNFGYPLNKFLSENVLKIVKRVCLYVVSLNIKAELPSDFPPPTTLAISKEPQLQNTTNELAYNNTVLDNGQILGKVR